MDYLFESVKLAKNANSDKQLCSDFGIGFNSRLEFSLPDGSVGKNIIIFGVDMSLSLHIDNKKRYLRS